MRRWRDAGHHEVDFDASRISALFFRRRPRVVAAMARVVLWVRSVAMSRPDHFHGMSPSPRACATTAFAETRSNMLCELPGDGPRAGRHAAANECLDDPYG